LHGAWPEAAVAAEAARQRLAGTPAAGDALYEQAELHRLRGDLACAEEAYRAASHAGRDPQPGLALLRLAQGDVVTALAAVTRVVDEAGISTARARMLGPFAEVSLAAGDVAAARRAVDELMASASGADTPYLDGVAAALMGRVELAEGDARAAIVTLRRAWRVWHELGAPFEAAQVRVAAACRTLGDADGAAMELDAATRVFDELGAAPDHARIAESAAPPSSPGRLTGREVEVLRLVAGGKSNRAAAGELFISEKTVARHLSNIYAKPGVASRSAAAAWAYEHGLMHLSA
jgi:ATP/maltotriose-dependent transcriptional regulator MalT